MKIPFKFKDVHKCEAVVLTCIDFRFWRETVEFVDQELGIKSYDFPSLPGAAKAINDAVSDDDVAMKCISVPVELHHVEKIILINHADCGAYGGALKFDSVKEIERKFHEEELKRAKEKILKKYPGKEVILVFAYLTDDDQIDFLKI